MSDDVKLKVPKVHVIMEDGRTWDVQTDNRDMIRWDENAGKRGWPDPSKAPFLWLTFIAWAALRRQGLVELSWDDFRGQALEVSSQEDEELDPTQTEAGPE